MNVMCIVHAVHMYGCGVSGTLDIGIDGTKRSKRENKRPSRFGKHLLRWKKQNASLPMDQLIEGCTVESSSVFK